MYFITKFEKIKSQKYYIYNSKKVSINFKNINNEKFKRINKYKYFYIYKQNFNDSYGKVFFLLFLKKCILSKIFLLNNKNLNNYLFKEKNKLKNRC
jgi:hypothetical protein